ncbi:MAG: FecR family protein [Polyangiaceae bacterium]
MSGAPSDCDRWAEIADRRMLGEALSDEEQSFAETHAESCALCRAESSAWAVIAESDGADALGDEDAEALVERALAESRERIATETEAKKLPLREAEAKKLPLRETEAEAKKLPLREAEAEAKKLPLREEPAAPAAMPSYAPSAGHGVVSLDQARKARTAYLAGGVAAALALAAGVTLMLRGAGNDSAGPSAVLVSMTGSVSVAGAPASVGMPLPVGTHIDVAAGSTACLTFDDGRVRTCLDASTELALAKTAADDRQLLLSHGTVVTSLDKLPAGHHFTVNALSGRAVVTGTVFSVSTSDDHKSVVVRVHEGSVRAEASDKPTRSVTTGQELDIRTESGRAVDPDVREHELALVGVTGPRAPRAAPPPSASVAQAPPPVPETSASAEPAVKLPSAGELLENARKLRAQGNSSGAAEAYRHLMAVHPKSAEAHAALLSLAELQLGPWGDPAGALRSYDAYLRGGGGLAQEARYGRIQALRRLGRAAEEQAAVDEFVKAYPNSVQARALKARSADAGSAP